MTVWMIAFSRSDGEQRLMITDQLFYLLCLIYSLFVDQHVMRYCVLHLKFASKVTLWFTRLPVTVSVCLNFLFLRYTAPLKKSSPLFGLCREKEANTSAVPKIFSR